MPGERIVAVALLTKPELEGLGAAFDRAWPVLQTPGLNGLLDAIDEADRKLSGEGTRHTDLIGSRSQT